MVPTGAIRKVWAQKRYAPGVIQATSMVILGATIAYWDQSRRKSTIKAEGAIGLEPDLHGDAITNFSHTHECRPRTVHEPETIEEAASVVQRYNECKQKLRPIGTALSPNGLGMTADGQDLINIGQCDRVLRVDKQRQQVTVEAGCTVESLTSELRKHGLTLPNFASINAQQLGGFTQVSAHGTGARIPPADEFVVEMEIITPAFGRLVLNRGEHPTLFDFARCGLGLFGIVSTITIQCVPAHSLHEKSRLLTHDEVIRGHEERLRNNKHVRYMWIPYTDKVNVVTSNPVAGDVDTASVAVAASSIEHALTRAKLQYSTMTKQQALEEWSFADLRDHMLSINPLDTEHLSRVNAIEAKFWEDSQGDRIAPSDKILAFECGGQQQVLEVTFNSGSWDSPGTKDVQVVIDLLQSIEKQNIPAPSPIEQRWSAPSTSSLSPAFSSNDRDIFTWIGIIFYLPNDDMQQRAKLLECFQSYRRNLERITNMHNAKTHWAKVEVPEDIAERKAQQMRLEEMYPLTQTRTILSLVDPHKILSNDWSQKILGW